MSNAALAKILRVCRLHSRNFLSRSRAGAESTDPLAWTEAAPRQLASRHRIDLARSYGRGVTARRLASYDDWRQSDWPYWGWDMAASVLATDPFYYSLLLWFRLRR